jgi:hypothetical protein
MHFKDLQFDKVSDHLIHADMMELVDDKKVIYYSIEIYWSFQRSEGWW